MNNNFTFLEEEQIFGDKALDIIKSYGTKAAITDFSILLGGYVSSNYYTSEGNTGKDRTGYYWTKTDDGDNDARVVRSDGTGYKGYVNERYGGCRPALPYSSIQSICSNGVRDNFGIKEVEYGEYPQTIVDESYSRTLERAYNNGNIKVTGKTYTTDSVRLTDDNTSFKPRQHQEFEYYGRKYIRFVGDRGGGNFLSDGREVKVGEPYWVAVEPIKWLVDEKEDIALAKKLIFSGVQFQNTVNYNGNFDKTDIKQFMDKYFSKEILASKKAIDLSNINLTLLGDEQLFGSNALGVIKKYGTKAKITDLAVIRGGYLDSDEGTGYYWTNDQYGSSDARAVDVGGSRNDNYVNIRRFGCRPALSYSSIQSICSNVVRDSNGIPTVICGEYPQRVVGVKMQYVLNTECNNGRLNKTGKNYTFDSRNCNDFNNGFSPEVYDEYEYQGKKYIRVKANSLYDGQTTQLPQSNWSCKDGDYVWMEVAPVEWIIDEKEDLAIAKNILVAGIRYDDENKYDGNFENTEMKEYLNKYMVQDLFQGIQPVMKFETMTEEPEQEVEPEVVEPIEPIEQPIIEKPHRSIFDFFRRKNKVNPNYVSVLKSELDTLSYDILFNVPDGPEKDKLNARFDWVMDYYNNNFNRLNDDKQDLEDLLFREKLNELTLDVKLSIEKSNENTQKRI